MKELHDKDLRHKLATDFAHSYMVDAGAGTGKTTVLVSRIIGAIETGIPLSRIAAITFTEKAAGELVMRVREKIEDKLSEADTGETDIWKTARADLENAPIGTIHSFCSSLIRKRPIEAGVDPSFEVMDNMQSRILIDEVWRAWIGAQLDNNHTLLEELLSRNVTPAGMKQLAISLVHNRDLLAEHNKKPESAPEPSNLLKDYEGLLEKAGSIAECCIKTDDKAYKNLPGIRGHLDVIKSELNINPLSLLTIKINMSVGAKGNWDPPEKKDELKEVFKEFITLINEWNKSINGYYADKVIEWLSGFVEEYQTAKFSAGKLDFQDLLLSARNMLRGGDAKVARNYFQNNFDIIMVDEFQDTDPLQVEVAFFLSEKYAEAANWDDVKPASGKLFVVGDPKQSIYRFRRADIEMYQRVLNKIRDINRETLVQNFRSAPELVGWFNEFFEKLFRTDDENTAQPGYDKIYPPPGYSPPNASSSKPGVWALPVAGVDYADSKPEAYEVRTLEAKAVARFLYEIKNKGWEVRDPDDKEWRPVEWKDIAVLFRSRTGLYIFADALDEMSIPYVAPGTGGLFEQPECRALIACLVAIDRPDDSVALVGALRSTFFGFRDQDILRAKLAGMKIDYTIEPPASDDCAPFKDAFDIFHDLHKRRNTIEKTEVIGELIERSGALALYSRANTDRSHLGNIIKIQEFARNYDNSQGKVFSSFIDHLFQSEETGEIEEAGGVESDQPVVKLMTVHGAKGLEFPVTVIADMTPVKSKGVGNCIKAGGRDDVLIKLGGMTSKGWEDAEKNEKAQQKLEKARLLYVACTRARDYLIIPTPENGTHPESFAGKAVEYIKEDGAEKTNFYAFDDVTPPKWKKSERSLDLMQSEESRAQIDPLAEWKYKREKLMSDIVRPLQNKSVTDIAKSSDEPQAAYDVQDNRAARLGNFVHTLLDMTDPARPETIDINISRALASSGVDTKDITIGINMAGRALDTPLLKRAAASSNVRKEFPLKIINDSGGYISGRIDLVFEEDGKLVILDYKTDDVKNVEDAVKIMEAGYREQIRLYAEFLEKITGMKVAEAIILFLRPDPPISMKL